MLVPILIDGQELHAKLMEDGYNANPRDGSFPRSWNWVDAYLHAKHAGPRPLYYRFLHQVLTTRRALLLIDGIDEGGAGSERLLTHVSTVLAPQGHAIICTGRPELAADARLAPFHQMRLLPLSGAQQQGMMRRRLGMHAASALWGYVQRLALLPRRPGLPYGEAPRDEARALPLTASPMMLSVVCAIYALTVRAVTSTKGNDVVVQEVPSDNQ